MNCPKCNAPEIHGMNTANGLTDYACGSYTNEGIASFDQSRRCLERQSVQQQTKIERLKEKLLIADDDACGEHAHCEHLQAEIERLQSELDNARGHREADNRESWAEIDRLEKEWTRSWCLQKLMNQCRCGSYAINHDPKRKLCDCCWRDATIAKQRNEIGRLQSELDNERGYRLRADLDNASPSEAANVLELLKTNYEQQVEIERLTAELDNERGHREADNRESRVEIGQLKVRLTCLKNDYATHVNDVRAVEEVLIEQREAEIEKLTADRQALLDASVKTGQLVMDQGKQTIEQRAEIERLEAVIGAYQKVLTAYRCGGRTPERALDLIGKYKAAERREGKP